MTNKTREYLNACLECAKSGDWPSSDGIRDVESLKAAIRQGVPVQQVLKMAESAASIGSILVTNLSGYSQPSHSYLRAVRGWFRKNIDPVMKAAGVLFFALLMASGYAQPAKPCVATTKAGAACKAPASKTTGYCRSHDPATPKCGATTKAGTACRWPVSKAGDKCKGHKG